MLTKLTFICLSLFIVLFTGNLNAQTSVCKVFFCNCCQNSGNGAYYEIYDFNTDTIIGSFTMDSIGCNFDGPANIVSGQVCYLETSCHGSTLATIVYFTGCVCQDGVDTIKIPCCPRNDGDNRLNFHKDKQGGITPKVFKLYQNYPNPFNPSTNIQFEIPDEGIVNLSIYDVKGTLIQTLINGNLKAGYHEFIWNGSNISSGVYFYKIVSGSFKDEKKMILIK